jgi:hypothetical protein
MYINSYTFIYMYTSIFIYIYIPHLYSKGCECHGIYIYVYIYTSPYIYKRIYLFIYIHTYIHIYIHIYTYIYIYIYLISSVRAANATVTPAERINCTNIKKQLRADVASIPRYAHMYTNE